jgi:AcrR family transcriptional regulator
MATRVPTTRPTALDAFLHARRKFLAGERIDMTALALELGVNRVTLYRWVGSREKLLVEVIWSLADKTFRNEMRRSRRTGSERVVAIVERFIAATLSNPGFAGFLAEEGELAMRLLTRRDTDFQPRLIVAVQDLLEEEVAAGRMDLPADLYDVAYTMVRIVESYIYLDLIIGERPDARRAAAILRLLLR